MISTIVRIHKLSLRLRDHKALNIPSLPTSTEHRSSWHNLCRAPRRPPTPRSLLRGRRGMNRRRPSWSGGTLARWRVFLLRAQQGLEYEEIAAALATTPGAARVHYHHAVRRLKETVK